MMLRSLGLSAQLSVLVLAGCNAISGVDSLTFDGGGAGGRGGGASGGGGGGASGGGGAAGGGDASGGGGGAACEGEACPAPTGVVLADQTFTEVRGDVTMGNVFMDACPEGQVIVGAQGQIDDDGDASIHGQIQAQCGYLNLAGTGPTTLTTTPGDLTPNRGDYGSVPWTRMCPENQVVVGFSGRVGDFVDRLVLDCAPLLVEGEPSALRVEVGPVSSSEGVGGLGGDAFPDTRCGEREVANLVHVMEDGAINAFGLGCKTVSLAY
ncbi:hypothetical protein [Sorangium sp. So ce590]|uniref:hypothetical protein n=1 Tax=unclassified Sorangium TaxID=2621164 RepID=UPI003F5FABD9